ncbi:MAG: response regulator, partial [Gammaproteobacteria bacterium]|nr:response regulator [Gammaproteobacteria bacterium]
EELNRRLPDLIVSDHHLPGMQGDALCQRVRQNLNTRGIPILMLTSQDSEDAELRGLESGADDYLSKSESDDVLLLRLNALLRKARATHDVIAESGTYFRKSRVLVVDDSATYRTIISGMLANEGAAVEQADNGEKGLELLTRQRFDCIVVDTHMPEMDGPELCRRITEMRLASEYPAVVLMVSSEETKENMQRAIEAGADDFVGKTSDPTVIKARINALLRRKFFQEENQRIIEELKAKELEAVRAREEKKAAEARAALVEKLEAANRELEDANRKLKEAQTRLVHSEKMASLGQLVAGIAHELNNPLSFVTNNLFLIGEGVEKTLAPLEDKLPEDSAKRIGKLRIRLKDTREGLDRVKDLVQKLRTFSRLDAGVFGTMDVRESVDMVLKFLHHKMKDRILVETLYEHREALDCYPGELNQVLMNVVANAVDAIDDDGTISIHTRESDGNLLISVRDTGCGIPPEVVNRIFEPFFTTKPVGSGMGLGLSLAYSIVQAHQGEIDVDSKPGNGTTFTIRIPLDLKERLKNERGSHERR